ncbi:pyrophosphohydrolase [Vibrio taketomensis]|uniref:pyrophosphohydrolase n=1 Tax=Vibrio taketomensis TaxID=2572923 RepID=UPI001E6290F1|nr:pyrophosphohydrolase [Vibrio taketomensis]
MPELKSSPTLADFQHYVAVEIERGFANQPPLKNVYCWVRRLVSSLKRFVKQKGLIDPQSKVGEIGDELSDIFIYLCSIANRYDIDLEQAFVAKERTNAANGKQVHHHESRTI